MGVTLRLWSTLVGHLTLDKNCVANLSCTFLSYQQLLICSVCNINSLGILQCTKVSSCLTPINRLSTTFNSSLSSVTLLTYLRVNFAVLTFLYYELLPCPCVLYCILFNIRMMKCILWIEPVTVSLCTVCMCVLNCVCLCL